jgi:polysaccharide biosynthesis transport protein
MTSTTVIRAIRRWWWTLLALALVGGLAGGVVSVLTSPTYTSTAQLIVAYDAPAGAGSSELVQANNFAIQKVYGYQEIATSTRVLDEVIASLGLDMTATELREEVSVSVPLETPVMQFRATAATPEDATTLATAFVDSFTAVITDIETPSSGGAAPVRIESLQDPQTPTSPASPDLLVNVALGVGAGIAVALVWIAVAAALDRRIHSASSIAASRATSGYRVLGSVPAAAHATTALITEPLSPASESYRTIAATVERLPGAKLGVIAVAPATPRDATSALSANIALAFKEFGARVALVDANLRSGTISSSLGLTGAGLGEVLRGQSTLPSCLHDLGGVAVLPAGATSTSPAELMSSNGFRRVIAELRKGFDIVVVDTAPVLPLSDALLATAAAESTILAVSAGRVTDTELAAAGTALTAAGVELSGVVVMAAPTSGFDADASTALYRDLRPARG